MTERPMPPTAPELSAQPTPVLRMPYQPPRVEPLGAWTALTLVTSLPVGPNGFMFGGSK